MDEGLRERLQHALQGYFERKSLPRLIITGILIFTGIFGFALSYSLLKMGVIEMWIRYPIAVLVSYGAFLGLLRIWVEVEFSRFRVDDPEIQAAMTDMSRREQKKWIRETSDTGWLDWLDLPDFGDGEGCLIFILVGVGIGLIAVGVMTVLGAPALVAEVFLDLFVVSLLYRRLQHAGREHWLGTAVGRTWHLALWAAVLMALAGFLLQFLAPETTTLGPAIRTVWEKWLS